jgi:hypothetical protein
MAIMLEGLLGGKLLIVQHTLKHSRKQVCAQCAGAFNPLSKARFLQEWVVAILSETPLPGVW